jgi:hypothetical protein
LIGGLTPGDGADPRTFPAIFNDAADTIEAQGTAIADLEDLNPVQFGTAVPSDGQVLAFSTAVSAYVPEDAPDVPSNAYFFVETVYFTSSGTFSKATYPWLRAIRVKCQGGGGAGGALTNNTSGGGGGAGGTYAESFITDIAGLAASVTVTVGAGGSGVTSAAGNSGASSSFGALVSGGGGGGSFADGGVPTGGTGDVVHVGSGGDGGAPGVVKPGSGGSSHLGGGAWSWSQFAQNQNGIAGFVYGGGGSGAVRSSAAVTGGAGANGIVIVELYG